MRRATDRSGPRTGRSVTLACVHAEQVRRLAELRPTKAVARDAREAHERHHEAERPVGEDPSRPMSLGMSAPRLIDMTTQAGASFREFGPRPKISRAKMVGHMIDMTRGSSPTSVGEVQAFHGERVERCGKPRPIAHPPRANELRWGAQSPPREWTFFANRRPISISGSSGHSGLAVGAAVRLLRACCPRCFGSRNSCRSG
jgi:hypothetical protein